MSSDSRILSAITAIKAEMIVKVNNFWHTFSHNCHDKHTNNCPKAEMIVKANNCSVFAVSVTASFSTPKVGTEAEDKCWQLA